MQNYSEKIINKSYHEYHKKYSLEVIEKIDFFCD